MRCAPRSGAWSVGDPGVVFGCGAAVDPFFAVPQVPHPTRAGEYRLPIAYRAGVQFGVLYRVGLAQARAVIGERTIEPCSRS